jgi:hypothetical protein
MKYASRRISTLPVAVGALAAVLFLGTLPAGAARASQSRAAVYPSAASPLVSLEQEVAVDDAAEGDFFGYSAAVVGNTAVIGAAYSTVDGQPEQGAVYVFKRSDGRWTQARKLTASDGNPGDLFGWSLDFDGSTIVVSANHQDSDGLGVAYVFRKQDGDWTQTAELTADNEAAGDYFAYAVAVSGKAAVVGAYGADVNGNDRQGAVYVFTRSGEDWAQTAKLTSDDGGTEGFFGHAVAIDGTTIVASADGFSPGVVYVFDLSGNTWQQSAEFSANGASGRDFFGQSLALSGDTALIGAPLTSVEGVAGAGAAFVFTRSGGAWTQAARLVGGDPHQFGSFGAAVAIDSDRVLVGADDVILYKNPGSAWLFKRSGGAWTRERKLTGSDSATGDIYGYAVALDGSTALVGAPHATVDDNSYQGTAYLYAQGDLSLAFSAPATVSANRAYVSQLIATNSSTTASPAVSATISVPAAASLVSAEASPAGTCSAAGGVVTCDFGAIDGNAGTATANLIFKAPDNGAASELVNTATLLHATPPLTASAVTEVVSLPVDLYVSGSVRPAGTVSEGDDITYIVTVQNLADAGGSATGTKLAYAPPQGVKFISASEASCTSSSGSEPSSSGPDAVTCDFGTIVPDKGKLVKITVEATAPASSIVATFEARSEEEDSDASNNTLTLRTDPASGPSGPDGPQGDKGDKGSGGLALLGLVLLTLLVASTAVLESRKRCVRHRHN